MSRRPVVGRQGPRAHAAELPAKVQKAGLKVTQIRSTSGHPETLRRTLKALGLRHREQSVVVKDDPGVRGMIVKVRHLVEVAPAGEA